MKVAVLTTSYPRGPDDVAGAFVRDAVLALRSAGVDVEVDETAYPNGRFAQLNDPEGNAIQLWEPKEPIG